MELGGRVAIITGAASGIGRATALRLAREGAKITVADIDTTWGMETVKLIEKTGGQAILVPTDVVREADAARCAKETLNRFGRVDILVNNAGVALVAKITETT